MPAPELTAQMCELWFRVNLTGDPQPMYSKFSLLKVSPSALTQAEVDNLANIANTNLVPLYSSSYSFGPHFVRDGRVGPSVRVDATVGVATGAAARNSLPNNCAWLIKCQTGVGRGGRIFLVGPEEATVSPAGFISSPELPALQTILNTLYGAFSTAPPIDTPGMWVLTAPLTYTPTPITSYVMQPQIATQRKRMRR